MQQNASGGIQDDSPSYEPATTGAPEKGIYRIVGGYLQLLPDGTRVLHNEVQLRAMTGHEEDLLANDSVPIFHRLNHLLASCCERFGTITDRSEIMRAIKGLPAGSRQHMLVCLRRVTHWKSTKDIYEMTVECPKCGKESPFEVNLAELDLYEMPDPYQRVFEETLPDSGRKATWRITESDQDEMLSAIFRSESASSELLTWAILVRLVSLDGSAVDIRPAEVLDPRNGEMLKYPSKRVMELKNAVKALSVGDRQHLRDRFVENEPGIDTDLEFTCPKCRKSFVGRLDLGQRSFFFPSATSRRSSRRSFI